MPFVELQRCFARVGREQEPNLEIGWRWGRKIGGWIDWPELRAHRRVVLLAEASSGKTAEFRNQIDALRAADQPAFFVTVEELADHGFESALEPSAADAFEQWLGGSGDGWFFLDSLDEARLNRKSFETALKRFARALGSSIERAHVSISCRVSDWKGAEDRGFIERLLPAWERPKEPETTADPLLDPIFKDQQRSQTRAPPERERKPNELAVVQLVPLSLDQCRVLAAHLGVRDVDAFINGIAQNGLEAFSERPGDVIDLADYWTGFGRFSSFAKMVEHGINRKLREPGAYRLDNEALSPQQAQECAERVAGALTLAKSFTLRAPAQDSDPSLAGGALDPAAILDELPEAKRNALLRRGVFAPATYGRVRFHHRVTQEYLTARWLDRLLQGMGPREAIWNLVFASRYGVDTIVPSLRPAAAWLALWHEDFRNEIIAREPLVLIAHGDPGSLSIDARIRLLAAYAEKQARSEIADDRLDNRDAWMFADPGLADAIREAWTANSNADFRFDLLRFIREGAIAACADLARGVALDREARDYHRVIAMQALVACSDRDSLTAVAQDLLADAANLPSHLSVESAKVLYPNYLPLGQLFRLIEQVRPPKQFSGEGFGYAIVGLFEATSGATQRQEFMSRLANLCLSRPLVDRYHRISARYVELAKHVEPIARKEVQALSGSEPPEFLSRLLMAVERAEREHERDRDGPSLWELVRANTKVKRALFWSDVAEQRDHGGPSDDPIYYWHVTNPHPLWQFEEADLDWLEIDLASRPEESDGRIALSAIVFILREAGRLDAELPGLDVLVKNRPHLRVDLTDHLRPPPQLSAEMRRHEASAARAQRQHAEQASRDVDSWRRFEQDLRQNPGQLCDPQKLKSWKAGASRLWSLTRWLCRRAEATEETALTQWRLLEEGFGREVAEAYRDGLRILWRATKPERPKRQQGGPTTINYLTILAFGAVGAEANEDPNWTSYLSDGEARQAARHGCLSERAYPRWIEALTASHPRAVLPVIRQAVRHEYLSRSPASPDLLYHYGRGTQSIHPAIQELLFNLIVANEPIDPTKFDCMVGMTAKFDLKPATRKRLYQVAENRLAEHRAAGRAIEARWSLAMLLLLDFTQGLLQLQSWLTDIPSEQAKEHDENTFAFLFDRNNPTIPSALANASVPDLERLLRLVYTHIRPEADAHHEGSYSPDTRDHAENARNSILGALLERPGAEAYYAFRRVANDPAVAQRAPRFRELARGKAQRDAEPPPWTLGEILAFERARTAPAKTGTDLLGVVEAVLKDIQFQFDKGDASSRRLLRHAQDEDEVQNWLAEQLSFRSRGRFRAFREAEVAQRDKPDIIVASTSASCEVAVEVKHSKQWTYRQLDDALRHQLAEDYLKPETRRHGVLVITHHQPRQWRDTETNEWLTFDSVIRRLAATAATLVWNSSGAIEVRCLGIDSSDPQ